METKIRALLKIGLLTNLLEWYEFSIYGYLAGTLGQLFFQTTQPTLALMLGLLPFTLSYLIRPLGSLFFGHIADRISRQKSLILSLFMMSVPTIIIGLLPTYEHIGSFATVAIIMLRLIQGFGAGGEGPISGCYIFEHAPLHVKGFLSSTINIGGILGFLGGSFTATVLAWCFDPSIILSWAWRIPFLLGIPITAYIAHIRHSILSSSISPTEPRSSNLNVLFTQHGKNLLQVILLAGFSATCYYSLITWMPTYLTYFVGVPQKLAQLMNTIVVCIMSLFWLASGYLSDRINYKKLMLYSAFTILLSVFPLFLLLQSKHYALLIISQCCYALILSGLDAPLVLYAGNSFPNNIRALGMSLGLTLGATIGGLTPLLCTWLIHKTGYLIAPALYILFFGLLALPIAFPLRQLL